MPVEPRRRKRVLSVYLREDIVRALEKVAADSGLTVSVFLRFFLAFSSRWVD